MESVDSHKHKRFWKEKREIANSSGKNKKNKKLFSTKQHGQKQNGFIICEMLKDMQLYDADDDEVEETQSKFSFKDKMVITGCLHCTIPVNNETCDLATGSNEKQIKIIKYNVLFNSIMENRYLTKKNKTYDIINPYLKTDCWNCFNLIEFPFFIIYCTNDVSNFFFNYSTPFLLPYCFVCFHNNYDKIHNENKFNYFF